MLLRDEISEGDFVIDATAGNGHDTVFLAKAVGESGKVLAIDIQKQAINSTASRLGYEGLRDRVKLELGCHADLAEIVIGERPSAIIFNLGYLPGGDHGLITRTEKTPQALSTAWEILISGGVLAVVCYPGHDGGGRGFYHILRRATHRPLRHALQGNAGAILIAFTKIRVI